MRSWAKRAMGAMVALVLLAGSASAQVPDLFARDLAQKLARAEVVLVEDGYGRAAGPFAGGLAPRQSRRFNVTLRAGGDYRIVGVCDMRCGDLDLRLFDPNNQMLSQDILDDAIPIIHARPRLTGQYTIEVSMLRCAGDPCWYAFNVYALGLSPH